MKVPTDGHTDRQTQIDFVICPMLYELRRISLNTIRVSPA